MKKRVFGILLVIMAVILTFTLVSCDKDGDTPSPTTYTVSYSAGEGLGTPPTGGEYEEGATFKLPQATGLTKDGFHFTAWNDGTTNYDAGATYTMPAKAVTFTAQWEEDVQPPVMHTVTFDPNNEGATWTEQVENGDTVAKPAPDPTIASGKHFRYWATEEGEEYSFDTPVTADLTLYAHYEFKVMFEAGEGEGTVEPMWVKTWTPAGIILPDETGLTHSEGKVFGGWNDGTTTYQSGDRFVGTGNHTFTAVWEDPATDITVSFETNFYAEGEAPASITEKHAGEDVTLPENTFTVKADYIGYVFKGWYVKGGDSSMLYQPGDTYTIASEFEGDSLVFMAKWDKGDFTITYKAGNHATGDDIVKNVKGGSNTLLELADITFTANDDYYFICWKKEGGTDQDMYDAGSKYMLGENTVFVAQYSRVYNTFDTAYTAQLLLYLDINSGCIYIQDEMVNLTFTLDGTAIEITLVGGTPATGSYDETGLAITLNYGGNTYTFKQEAQLTEPTITFKAGGGSGVAPEATVSYDTDAGMYKIVLPNNTYNAPAGKEFKCWSIDGHEYKAGTSYMANSGEAITITAVWQDVQQEEPVFEGTTFEGNCTTPTLAGPFGGGGQTYVKFIISTDKTKVQYTLSDGTAKEANLTDDYNSSYKPDKYGADALYYSVKMENVSYYLLVKADMSALSMCNSSDELLENGEFLASAGEVSEYTTIALKDLAGKNFVLSDGATEIYNGYTTLAFTWDPRFSSYTIKLGGKSGSISTRSYMTAENSQELSGTTFTATHSSSRQVMTFAFIKDGDAYQMVIISIKDTDGTEHVTTPITLVEKTA